MRHHRIYLLIECSKKRSYDAGDSRDLGSDERVEMSANLKLVDSERGVIDRALEIAERRRNTLLRLKIAIRAKRLEEADQLVTELVPDEESHRVNKSFNRSAGR